MCIRAMKTENKGKIDWFVRCDSFVVGVVVSCLLGGVLSTHVRVEISAAKSSRRFAISLTMRRCVASSSCISTT